MISFRTVYTKKCYNRNSTPIKLYLFLGFSLIYTPLLFAQNYGLKFQAQEVPLDKRTEFNLTPQGSLNFEDEFEISFDYKIDLIYPNSLFGYVFRIINQDYNNIDLLSTPSPDIRLNIVIGNSDTIIPVNYPAYYINNWINIRLKIFLSEDKLILFTPDSSYVHEKVGFNKKDAFKIIFGANDFQRFKSTDVPSMNIKNVKIFEKGKLKYYWLLNEPDGNIAIDQIRNQKATVKNPVWLRRRHHDWQNKYEVQVKGTILFASDSENGRIFMVGDNQLLIYSVEDERVQEIGYKNKPLFLASSYRSVYVGRENRIYCYLVDKGPFYSLNVETGEWDNTGYISDFESKYLHHNRFYNPSDHSLYLFGGYGFHKYNNEIRKIDLKEGRLHHLPSSDSIYLPRYLAGLGFLNDTIYILGGYGSKSGNQLINPRSYYDLLGYSIRDCTLFKKFEITPIIEVMSVANSFWIDGTTRDFYALVFDKTTFDGYLQLIKGNLDYPDIELVGNRIPFRFLDIRSYADLVYIPQLKEIFAYTSYVSDSATTEAKIYAISYPPNLFSQEPDAISGSKLRLLWLLAIPFALLLGSVIWFYRQRKRKLTKRALDNTENALTTSHEDKQSVYGGEKKVYHVILFGGFQVFNKEWVDITHQFSPLLKELFLLILLHTFKNDKGISNEKITEILWYDKPERSARNNKAVNIAKLRRLIGEIGNCDLTKDTGYWKIIPDKKKVKCDYIDFLSLTASKTNLTKTKVSQIIEITQQGAFLQNVQYKWLDQYKAFVSDTIIDTLVDFGQSCDMNKEAEFIIHLADSIFNFDLVNEEAMILKCRAQYCMGKHGLAKETYERFYDEYLTMYNQEYSKSFLNILELEN